MSVILVICFILKHRSPSLRSFLRHQTNIRKIPDPSDKTKRRLKSGVFQNRLSTNIQDFETTEEASK